MNMERDKVKCRFCLVYEKFVLVSNYGRASLMDIFKDDSLIDIAGNPIAKMAMMKFLIAIAQAAVRLEDRSEWKALGPDGLADKVCEYLASHRECFYLYGDKPFLQMPVLSDMNDVDEQRIYYDYIPDMAWDNDTVFKEMQDIRELSDGDKAVFIIQLMNYALGGKRTSFIAPLTEGYALKSKSAKPGPSLGNSVGYLQVLLKGRSIRETVWLNYFTDSDIRSLRPDFSLDVRPPWEVMPEGEDDEIARELKRSVYAWLCALSRFVLLTEDGIKYTEGLQYPSSIKDGYFEPFITINEEEKKVLYADPAKKTWRNLQSLLSAVYHGDHDSPYRCMQMVKFWQRTVSACDSFNLWTGGLRVRTNSGDQSVKQSDDYVESEIRLRSKDLGTNFFLDFCNGMKRIDSYALLLRDNMKKYFKAMKSGDASSAKAVAYYWMAADEVSDDFMDACNADDGKKRDMVMSHLYGVMLGLYDAFCPHETGRQIMIWIKYRPFTGGAKMSKSDKYVDYVFSRIKDKAMAADLRHGDNSAYSVKAAARIHRFVDIGNDTQVRIYTLIGSAIVKSGQKENGTCGLGNAYWRIYHDTCREDEFPHRLERLLACDDIDELLDLLRQSLSLIRSKGIQLDFARLLREVESFRSGSEKRNKVRASWASDYFNKGDVIDE